MKAVITVVGKDTVGILSYVSKFCADYNANIIDVSQTILDNMFCMMMICDIEGISIKFNDFSNLLKEKGKEKNLEINVMHEDIFNSMHRI